MKLEVPNCLPKIQVCVRKRPISKKETSAKDKEIVFVSGPSSLVVKEQKLFN